MKCLLRFLGVLVTASFLSGCATTPSARLTRQLGEPVVFIGEEPAHLAFLPAHSQPLRVRNDGGVAQEA